MKKAYLACPMVGIHRKVLTDIIEKLSKDWEVYFPPRHTTRDLGHGAATENLEALKEADMVFVVWEGQSRWVLFAMGMAFALGKPIQILESLPTTEWISFQNVLFEWAKEDIDEQDETTDEGTAGGDD